MRNSNTTWKTLPNFLSIGRLAAVPFLILVSLLGVKVLFYIIFLMMLITDALDGYLARKLNQTSELGAKIDGWADLAMWGAALVCVWLLWPAVLKRELPFAIFALSAYVLPMIAGYIKYGKVPVYHCYSAKIQAVLMSFAVPLLIFFDISWFFRVVALTQGITAMEDIIITILLPEAHYDVLSFWHALKFRSNQ